MPRVTVASLNPVKVNAVRAGFRRLFPDQTWEVTGCLARSGVSHQPMSDAETLHGAESRAHSARTAESEADYWVGIEGGAEERDGVLHGFAWVVVLSREQEGRSRTASFEIPPAIATMVREGVELGEADDRFFQRENSKKTNGAVGMLTGDVVDREELYAPAVVLALIPFRNRELFPSNQVGPDH